MYIFLNIITLTAFLRLRLTLFRCVFGSPPQASIPYSAYGLMNGLYKLFNSFSGRNSHFFLRRPIPLVIFEFVISVCFSQDKW